MASLSFRIMGQYKDEKGKWKDSVHVVADGKTAVEIFLARCQQPEKWRHLSLIADRGTGF